MGDPLGHKSYFVGAVWDGSYGGGFKTLGLFSMEREKLIFPKGWANICIEGNLIYVCIHGIYEDNDAIRVCAYLEPIVVLFDKAIVRVHDSFHVSPGGFRLTSRGAYAVAQWTATVHARWPGSVLYLIAYSGCIYGMSRVHSAYAESAVIGDEESVFVLRSFLELPKEIQERILNLNCN